MDKFSYWVLKGLSYLFILSAVAMLVMWINEDDSYRSNKMPWILWASGILTSLFFSAVSHVSSRIIMKINEKENEEYGYIDEAE